MVDKSVTNGAKVYSTLITLSNAVELGAHVIKEVIGDDISDVINGESLTSDIVKQMILSDLTKTVLGA